jgi:hypothetical protein
VQIVQALAPDLCICWCCSMQCWCCSSCWLVTQYNSVASLRVQLTWELCGTQEILIASAGRCKTEAPGLGSNLV